jgi:hypothetical protein
MYKRTAHDSWDRTTRTGHPGLDSRAGQLERTVGTAIVAG